MAVFIFHLLIFLLYDVQAEQYRYFLDIRDKLNPDWIQSDLPSVSRIECADLCYKQKSCSYFGYNADVCHLLKDSVDEDQCPDESCANPGMKIYKLREVEVPTTTMTTTTTTKDTTTKPTTTTTKSTTPTTEPSTTEPTTTEPTTTEPTTTEPTTTEPTTTEPTTTEPTTTEPTTTEPTTTKPTTTEPTTTEPTTTEPTTTEPTTTEPTTTVPTTTVPTTTVPTTTVPTTTEPTTTKLTTTEGGTTTPATTSKGPFTCEPPKGAEAFLFCPLDTDLLNGMGSKSPFFGDALSAKCEKFSENLYDITKEKIYTFFSLDGGFSVSAQCENEYDVIIQFKLCVMDAHIPALTIHCAPIKNTDLVDKIFNSSSEKWKDALTDCDSNTGFQKMFFSDAGNAIITRVIFQCVHFDIPSVVPGAVVDNKPATG